MPNPTVVRLFDAVLGFLLHSRVRRVRRWSFLLTLPLGVLAGRSLGLDLGDGLVLGAIAALLDAAVMIGVVLAGTRLLGRERRDALLDLFMHPLARRAIAGEARMLSTFPTALVRRVRGPRGKQFACHRGSHDLGFAIALLPAMLAEGAAVHLLLPDAWFWPKVAIASLHVYGVVMLLSWAAGQRTHPHRLRGDQLELRGGQLYRLRVAASQVESAEIAQLRDGQRTGLVLSEDGPARLAVGGRTDVLLRFAAPTWLERPLGDPLPVDELAIAVDNPERLLAAVDAARRERPPTAVGDDPQALLAWLAPADLAEALS